MRPTRRLTRTAAWAAAGVLGAGAVSGVAYAATGQPSAGQPATTAGRTAGRPGLLRALEHGELTLRARGGDRTVDLQRGTLTAVGPTAVTVASRDGFTATYTLTPQTKVRGGVAALHRGERVLVVATGGRALRVASRPAPAAPPSDAPGRS